MGWATAISAGVSLLGGAMSSNAASRGADSAASAQAQALREYLKVNMPSLSDQEIELVIPQLAGQLTPEAEQVTNLGPSAMENVSADEAIKAQQMDALQKMSEIGEAGLTEGDMAAARGIQRQSDQSNQARQKAILQNMEQRGVGGSGMELIARMQSSQSAAESQAEANDRLMQQAQNRVLQGISKQGAMASQLRGQDVGEQTAQARARDEIARVNMMNQAGVQQRNVSNRNQAQVANLQARQQLENQRAQTINRQEQYNKALKDKVYKQEMTMAGAKAGVYGAQGKVAQDAAAGEARGIGTAVGGITDIAGSFMKTDDKK